MTSEAEAKPSFALPVGTVTFLLTDIEGSSRRWETDRDQMAEAVAAHYAILDDAIGLHGGVRPVEQGEGDSIVAAFARASDAVDAAVAAQLRIVSETDLKVRMSIHTGEAQLRNEGNYFGTAINRCARLRALAHGGQVLLSRASHDLVVDRLPPDVSLADLGSHRLRDLGRPEHVYQLVHAALPADFPPLRSLDAAPHNLPTQLTSFIGRESELAQVRDLMNRNRHTTLTGAGGCGKTRLALQAAAEAVDEHQDGVWWVELGSLSDPALVAAALGAALGLRDEPGRPLIEALSEHLRDKDALIVLDNCEHVLTACGDLAVSLLSSCPLVSVLATSREPLGIQGETAWRVPSLRLPKENEPAPVSAVGEYDAIRMFAERAVGARPNFALTRENVDIVTQICRRLDGIPLAIELAAARTRVLSPSQIASALDDRFRLLTGGSRTVMPRQQTLRASVQWSYDLLRDDERVVLRRLSTFAGGFSLDAAEAIAAGDGVDPYDVLDLLTSLVDKSLVVADETNGGTRYRLLETIRQFGGERLLEAGEGPSVRDRHLAWFLAFAEQAQPNLVTRDQLGWLADLEQEHDNLRAALQWASGESLARLATALTFFWSMRGLFREGIEWLDRAFEGVDEPGPIEVEAMWGAAHLRAYGGLARAGFSIASDAEAHARRLGDPRLTGRTLNTRGFMVMWADPRAGRALLEASVAYARESNDLWCLCDSLQLAAWTWMLSGTPRTGRPLIDEAMTVTRETGDRAARAWQLVTIGMELGHHGEMATAAAPLGEAAELAESLGDPWMFGWAAAHLGYLEMYRGRYADAHAWLDRGLNFARESGARGPLGLLANMVAMVQLAEGDPAAAIETNAGVMAIRRGRADAWGYACCVLVLGAALAKVGDFTGARGRAEEGLDSAERLDSPFMRAWSRWTLGVIAFLEGDIDSADEEFHATLAHASSGPYPSFVIDALDGLATVSARRGDHAVATRIAAAAERARETFEYVRPALLTSEVEHARTGARETLGNDAFDAAWVEGSALSIEDAVEYASRARGERRRPTAGWKSLTPTELQVIRYVVEGLTNPQIGERMFISRGTVKTHLAHVFGKLGMTTRAELAAEAAKRGLGD